MSVSSTEKETVPSLLNGFKESSSRVKDVLLYALPSGTTIESVVTEIIGRNKITGVYFVPQALYQQRMQFPTSIPDIYEFPVSRPDKFNDKSFHEIRNALGHKVLNFANLVQVEGKEMWIPCMDINPVAKNLPLNVLAQELVVELGLGDGFLVDSGAGLHFWGLDVVSYHDWERMFISVIKRRNRVMGSGKSDNLAVDDQWLLQLNHYSVGPYALRVTDWPEKNKPVPKPLYWFKRY